MLQLSHSIAMSMIQIRRIFSENKLKEDLRSENILELLSKIKVRFTFTSTEDEKNFYKIHYLIEKMTCPVISLAEDVITFTRGSKLDQLADTFQHIATMLESISKVQKEMRDATVNPSIFFHTFRPYFASIASGIKFQGLSGFFQGKAQVYPGPSGAQTSLFPFLDSLFGLHYTGELANIMSKFRFHWPSEHRKYVQAIEKKSRKINQRIRPSEFVPK